MSVLPNGPFPTLHAETASPGLHLETQTRDVPIKERDLESGLWLVDGFTDDDPDWLTDPQFGPVIFRPFESVGIWGQQHVAAGFPPGDYFSYRLLDRENEVMREQLSPFPNPGLPANPGPDETFAMDQDRTIVWEELRDNAGSSSPTEFSPQERFYVAGQGMQPPPDEPIQTPNQGRRSAGPAVDLVRGWAVSPSGTARCKIWANALYVERPVRWRATQSPLYGQPRVEQFERQSWREDTNPMFEFSWEGHEFGFERFGDVSPGDWDDLPSDRGTDIPSQQLRFLLITSLGFVSDGRPVSVAGGWNSVQIHGDGAVNQYALSDVEREFRGSARATY